MVVVYRLLIILLIGFNLYSQDRLALSIQQDLKLAVVGDEKRGYNAFTTDALIRLEMQGIPNHIGYAVVFPEYEFVDRTDLQWLWGVDEIRFSGFIGLEIKINNKN